MTRDTVPFGVMLGLIGFALFSTHDAVIKALGAYSAFQIMFFTSLFGMLPILLMVVGDPEPGTFRPNRPWWLLARVSATLVAALSVFYAFGRLPFAQAYAIIFTLPLIVTALSVPMLGERVGIRRWTAIAIGLVGVLVVLRPGAAPLSWAHAAAIAAALGASMASVIVRKIGRDERLAVMVIYPVLGMILLSSLALPFVYQPMPLGDLAMFASVGILGVVAQLVMVSAYRRAPAAVIAPLQYTQIIWASLFGALIFRESLDAWTVTGTAIIIGSGLFALIRGDSARRAIRAESQPDGWINRAPAADESAP